MNNVKYAAFFLTLILLIVSCDQPKNNTDIFNQQVEIVKAISANRPDLESSPELVRQYIKSHYAVLEKSSTIAVDLGRLGDVLFANKFYEHARQVYLKMTEIEPKEHRWQAILAVTLHRLSDIHAGVSYIANASTLKPNDLATVFYEAVLHEELGNYSEAKVLYGKAHSLSPEIVETNFALGRLLFNLGEYQASLKYLETATKLAPDSSLVRSQLVRLSKIMPVNIPIPDEAGASNNALLEIPHPYYLEIMAHGRSNNDLRFNARRAMATKNTGKAIDYLTMLIDNYPDSAFEHEYIDLAHYQAERGNFIRVKAIYIQAMNKFPSSAKALLGHADIEFKDRNLDQAEEGYRRALGVAESDGDQARVYQGLGRISATKGDLPSALNNLNKSVKLWPENPIFHMDLMRILADLGQYKKAKEHLDTAEKLGLKAPTGLRLKIYELAASRNTDK